MIVLFENLCKKKVFFLPNGESLSAVYHEISYLAFRSLWGGVLLFRYAENQFVIRVFQFRFQHVDPGNIKIVAPFGESIQFFERGAVDTIFQDSGRRSADAENTDRFPPEIQC